MKVGISKGSFTKKKDGRVYFTFTTSEPVPQEVLDTIYQREVKIEISDEVFKYHCPACGTANDRKHMCRNPECGAFLMLENRT